MAPFKVEDSEARDSPLASPNVLVRDILDVEMMI
jgi:hypothetical protein